MKIKYESMTQKHMKNIAKHILLKTNLQWAKDQEHRVKTEKNESRKSQLKFEYDVHLLNYIMKIKNKKVNWAFEVF